MRVPALAFFVCLFIALTQGVCSAANYQIEINKSNNELILFKDSLIHKKYPVATGRTKDLTPEGTFTMVVKINQPGWKTIPGGRPDNPLGEKWMGFSVRGDKGRTYGMHGTNQPTSIGKYVTNGCIRLDKEDLLELYSLVSEGIPVWIHHGVSSDQWQGDPSYGLQPKSGKLKVVVNEANVRTGPSLGSFIKKYKLKKDQVVDSIGYVNGWYKIKLPNGEIGFTYGKLLEPIQDPPAKKVHKKSAFKH